MLFFIVHASTSHECTLEEVGAARLRAAFPSWLSTCGVIQLRDHDMHHSWALPPTTFQCGGAAPNTDKRQSRGSRLVFIHQNHTDSSEPCIKLPIQHCCIDSISAVSSGNHHCSCCWSVGNVTIPCLYLSFHSKASWFERIFLFRQSALWTGGGLQMAHLRAWIRISKDE